MESIFKNEPIDISALPKAEEIEWIPIQKKYLPIALFPLVVMILLVIITFIVVQLIYQLVTPSLGWFVFGFLLLLFSTRLIIRWLGFKYRAYALREEDISYRSGLIFRTKTTVPFHRIQHSKITQGPLESKRDLAKLLIFTAGGRGADLGVPGLPYEEAHNIKAFINEKIKENV